MLNIILCTLNRLDRPAATPRTHRTVIACTRLPSATTPPAHHVRTHMPDRQSDPTGALHAEESRAHPPLRGDPQGAHRPGPQHPSAPRSAPRSSPRSSRVTVRSPWRPPYPAGSTEDAVATAGGLDMLISNAGETVGRARSGSLERYREPGPGRPQRHACAAPRHIPAAREAPDAASASLGSSHKDDRLAEAPPKAPAHTGSVRRPPVAHQPALQEPRPSPGIDHVQGPPPGPGGQGPARRLFPLPHFHCPSFTCARVKCQIGFLAG